ncbi:alpha-ketoglutarate-dependent dioxygenase alkB homolog 4 [Cryptotermes secundus]|uniref:alpha-ketoglutarate-dependent dioxygenase alkB homolog 4 n=1 Tax=Cryptotermes secundus TaxID=105785 RepID=UPI000CD7C92B|nr:alpha-ketoglutarate-dependent dioxygenase alkB homolog 4 [Cryptotermes secundus]
MEFPRSCGCKGIRTCLICEKKCGIQKKDFIGLKQERNAYVYCPWCKKAWPGWDVFTYEEHLNHSGTSLDFPGIFIKLDFLNVAEEECLMSGIDKMAWDPSQSGRRKQNFGPKCNFKKKRLKLGNFKGFPGFTRFVQEKFKDVNILKGYRTVEQCSLEYSPTRGASIDPHIDDCWVWGERIVTVNLLADCILTMTQYHGEASRYNLRDVDTYPPVLNEDGKVIDECKNADSSESLPLRNSGMDNSAKQVGTDVVVRVPMPRRSLLVMYGPARYLWEHTVLREDVLQRRVCLAYREFTPTYLEGGKHACEGSVILDMARNFWDHKSADSIN